MKNKNYKKIEKIYESEIKLNDKLENIDKYLKSLSLNLTNVQHLSKKYIDFLESCLFTK